MKTEREIDGLLSRLTLEEKIGMIHGAGLFRTEGVERLGIPPLYMSDGPMGVRAEFANDEWKALENTDDYVTYLPSNSALASTWNRELAGRLGEVLGEEARGRGKDVILAPGINIKRSPLCGRNFEYMSEDPRLVEELAVPLIQGIQQWDVAACVKHFAVNSQETGRLWVDTLVDERTLREIYLPGFLAAIRKGGVLSLMGAYNRLNGEHCSTSNNLLNKLLREEWQYDGMVVSDWGGVHDTVLAAESGLDIEMDVICQFDRHYMADALLEKIRAGELSEELIDRKVRNILRLMFRLRMIGSGKDSRKAGTYNTEQHRHATKEIAREAVVLLKNEDHLLPLSEQKVKKVAVIGQNADIRHAYGGGSAEIKALYEITPLMGIKKLLGGNVQVSYAPGYVVPGKEKDPDVNWQAESTKSMEAMESVQPMEETEDVAALGQQYLEEALQLAEESDTVIFVGGLTHDQDIEGQDRSDMKLPYGQDRVIEALLNVKPDMVVVIYAGSPVEMAWRHQAKAILWSYYAGMEGGSALAETLFGRVNPSGKLAETFIESVEQCPAHSIGTFGDEKQVFYGEGVMIGYRYYDTENTEAAYCFGHGLSYTSFEYSELEVREENREGETVYQVSLTVTNTGEREGKETVQLYVAPIAPSVLRPAHELKVFDKIDLKTKEGKRVLFTLRRSDFAYYSPDDGDFVTDAGEYEIQVGASSRDIRLKTKVTLNM